MAVKELFRQLEIEAHRPRKARALDSFLPRPEAWPSQLRSEEEVAYKVTDEDVAGLETEGSVSLEELLDKEIPEEQRAAAAQEAPKKEPAVSEEDLDGLELGGSVTLEELLGENIPGKSPKKPPAKPPAKSPAQAKRTEDVPTRPAASPPPPQASKKFPTLEISGDLLAGSSKKAPDDNLSLEDILDDLVPDEPKKKK
ncbi:MAG: hypothetical protein JSV08_09930 [Acidobacteriota bacterium]|nr:MAG: hypothetical protein JSV08_09930 [Acidobacteriota bacterium]